MDNGILKVKLVSPDSRIARKIECDVCGISYSKRDYKTLFVRRKIIYFNLNKRIICNECIFQIINEIINDTDYASVFLRIASKNGHVDVEFKRKDSK